jgi:hypothetical protein
MHTRLEDAVCSDVLRVLDPEQSSKLRTSAMNPAFDGATPRSANFGSLFIGEALRRHQQKCLTLFNRKVA